MLTNLKKIGPKGPKPNHRMNSYTESPHIAVNMGRFRIFDKYLEGDVIEDINIKE